MFELRNIYTKLLDSAQPNNADLELEGSGCARVESFLLQMETQFRPMIRNPGDANILDGLRTNFLRIAADYY